MNRFTIISTSKGLSALSLAALGLALLFSSSAHATPIFDTFGPLDGATFSGTGIPTEEVAVSSQIVDGDVTITIAMSATQRYFNPALTNNGAGTYLAGTGSNFGGPGSTNTTEGALWNFNYYMKVEGTNGATPVLADYQFDLYYDFNTGFDTPLGSLGKINVTNALLVSAPATTLLEDSQNLKFGSLATAIPGFVTPPAGVFDENATGEYNFAITVSSGGFPLETVAIDVQVVPEPTTLALVAFGICALGFRRRKSA